MRTSNLHWIFQDEFGVLLRKYPTDNLEYILRYGVLSDAGILCKYLSSIDGSVAIDVGANRGQISVMLAKNFERVIAVEPDLENLERLTETLMLNSITNVEIKELALSSRTGVSDLRVSNDYGHHTLESRHISSEKETKQVRIQSLDDACKIWGVQRIDLLKIDVEGHEMEVLKGAMTLLNAGLIKSIIFEHSPVLSDLQKRDIYEVHDLLVGMGFVIFSLDLNLLEREELPSIGQIDLLAKFSDRSSISATAI